MAIAENAGKVPRRRLVHRAILLYLHIVCAISIGCVSLSIRNLSSLSYWNRGGSFGVAMIVAIPMLPYWSSGYQSRRRVNYSSVGFWIFCTVILVSACAIEYLYVRGPVGSVSFAEVAGLSVAQLFIYLFATGMCLGNEIMPAP